MTKREELQNSVRKWRLCGQPFTVRGGRYVLLEAAIATSKTPRALFSACACTSIEQARGEMAAIVKDELERIARASQCTGAPPGRMAPAAGNGAKEKRKP